MLIRRFGSLTLSVVALLLVSFMAGRWSNMPLGAVAAGTPSAAPLPGRVTARPIIVRNIEVFTSRSGEVFPAGLEQNTKVRLSELEVFEFFITRPIDSQCFELALEARRIERPLVVGFATEDTIGPISTSHTTVRTLSQCRL